MEKFQNLIPWLIGFSFGAALFYIDLKIISYLTKKILDFTASVTQRSGTIEDEGTKQSSSKMTILFLCVFTILKMILLGALLYFALVILELNLWGVFSGALVILIFFLGKILLQQFSANHPTSN